MVIITELFLKARFSLTDGFENFIIENENTQAGCCPYLKEEISDESISHQSGCDVHKSGCF